MLGNVLLGLAIPAALKLASNLAKPAPRRRKRRARGARLGYVDIEELEHDEDPLTPWERTAAAVERGRAPRCPKEYAKATRLQRDNRKHPLMPCRVKSIEHAITRAFAGPCKSARLAYKKAAASCAKRGLRREMRRYG